MEAKIIDINWHTDLPIFAKESLLRAVSDDYGWFGGYDRSQELRYILPFTILRKSIFSMMRFRTACIFVGDKTLPGEETRFLNAVLECSRSLKVDIIIPASNNAIFQAYPDGADVAPYGSYMIDLTLAQNELWYNIKKKQRQNINKASKRKVTVSSPVDRIAEAYSLIKDTFRRSKLPFMNFNSFKKYGDGLAENGRLMVADHEGLMQSCVLFAFSDYCAYAVYGGNLSPQISGANKLLHWDAICMFKEMGIKRYDFYGARINPEPGSKQEEINSFKRRLGGKLNQGYMWKYPLNTLKSAAYTYAVRLLRGGDIVDIERHKAESYSLH